MREAAVCLLGLGVCLWTFRDAPVPWFLPEPPVVPLPRAVPATVTEEVPFVGLEGVDAYGYPFRKPDKAVVLGALQQGRFALLERWMAFFQDAFERDFRKEFWPDTMLYSFTNIDPEVGKRLDEWVAKSPRHYAAWAARGVHRFALGWHYRGDKFARQTSFAQFHKMEKLHAEAARDFARALELKPKLAPAYLYLGILWRQAQGPIQQR